MRKCFKCGVPATHSLCRKCGAERMRLQRSKWHKEGLCRLCGKKPYASGKYLCQKCREAENRRDRQQTLCRRLCIIKHYGGKCVCCGEPEPFFLTLDHKNNNGASHRKTIGITDTRKFYAWAIRNGFPKFLQLLCWNCNLGKKLNGGTCPHQKYGPDRHRSWRKIRSLRSEDRLTWPR